MNATLILNAKTNEHLVLCGDYIFNPILKWNYQKLITEYPRVLDYIEQVDYDEGIVREIARKYKARRPYDDSFDVLAEEEADETNQRLAILPKI